MYNEKKRGCPQQLVYPADYQIVEEDRAPDSLQSAICALGPE